MRFPKLPSFVFFIGLFSFSTQAQDLLKTGTTAPEFNLSNVKGGELSSSDFKGTVLVIDFFYKACPPCNLAFPGLIKLHDKYFEKGLNVIGIDPYDNGDILSTFMDQKGIDYPVLLGNRELVEDYHVPGFPCIYIIDKKGKIIYADAGYDDNMEKELEKVIVKNL